MMLCLYFIFTALYNNWMERLFYLRSEGGHSLKILISFVNFRLLLQSLKLILVYLLSLKKILNFMIFFLKKRGKVCQCQGLGLVY